MLHRVSHSDDGPSLSRANLIDPRLRGNDDESFLSRRQPTGKASRGYVSLGEVRAEEATDGVVVAEHVMNAVLQRLTGRVRDLEIRAESDHRFVLSGIVNSYYSKQVAQHAAMEAMSPGDRLVNDIEVRTVR